MDSSKKAVRSNQGRPAVRFVSSNAVLSLLGLVILVSCGEPGPEGVVETEVVDGVLHVYSPSVPMWGPESAPFTLTEVLGSETSGDTILFSRPLAVSTGRDGTRYVLDQRSQRIWMFDRSGEESGSIGRNGEGPGEFGSPVDLAILSDGSLAVLDPSNLRISFFESDGRFVRAVRIEERLGQLEPAGPDRLFVYRRDRTMSGRTMVPELDPANPQILVLDVDGNREAEIAPRHVVTGQMVDVYVNKLFMAPLPGDSLLLTYQGLARAEVWSPLGELARVMHRTPPFELEPPVFEERPDPSGGSGMIGYEYDLLSSGLAVHPDGQFWAILVPQGAARVRTPLLGESEIPEFWSIDLFDADGLWLARQPLDIPCPHALLDWGPEGLYLLNPQEDAIIYRFDFAPQGV